MFRNLAIENQTNARTMSGDGHKHEAYIPSLPIRRDRGSCGRDRSHTPAYLASYHTFHHLLTHGGSLTKRSLFLAALFLAGSLGLMSGQQVSGVVHYGGQPVELCTVVAKNVADSAMIAGAVTDSSGGFLLERITKGNYLLEVSRIGYRKQRIPLCVGEGDVPSLRIELTPEEIALGEVVVRAASGTLRKSGGMLMMKVEHTPLAEMSSPLDLIAYLPGVVVSGDKIRLVGKDNVLVLIDNRKASSVEEVERLRVNAIRSVALERNAGVRYGSGYKSILRIVTKEGAGNDLEVGQRTRIGREVSNWESVDYDIRAGKQTFNLGIRTNFRGELNYYTKERYDKANETDYYGDQRIKNRRKGMDVDLGYNYAFGAGHYLQFYDDFYVVRSDQSSQGTTTYRERMERSRTETLQRGAYTEKTNRLNLFYRLPLPGDSRLEVNVDYIYQSSGDHQDVAETDSLASDLFRINQAGKYHVYTVQADYSGMLWRAYEGLIGVYFMDLSNRTEANASQLLPISLDNQGRHRERQFAWYAKLRKDLGKVEVEAGIREEFIRQRYSQFLSDSLWHRRTHGLFPFISISARPSSRWNVSLTFDRKMNLPSYQELNPVVTYHDKYSYGIGNIDLRPVVFNSVSLDILYNEALDLTVEYAFVRDRILGAPSHDPRDSRIIRISPLNIERNHQIVIGANYAKQWGSHRLDLSNSLLLQRSDDGEKRRRFFLAYSGTLNYGARLRKNIYAYLRMRYTSREEDTYSCQQATFDTTVGLSLSFWNKRLQVTLSGSDLFHTNSGGYLVNYWGLSDRQRNNLDSRQLTVSLRYNLNKRSYRNRVKEVDELMNRL